MNGESDNCVHSDEKYDGQSPQKNSYDESEINENNELGCMMKQMRKH